MPGLRMLELRVGLSSARLGELRLLCGRRPVWADAMANPSCLCVQKPVFVSVAVTLTVFWSV